MSTDNIVVSFSGGRSSAMMCWLLENHEDYKNRKKHYVFFNTGKEMPETISFAKRWIENYLEVNITVIEANVFFDERNSTGYKIVDWLTLSMDGQPNEDVVRKYGLPSIAYPHCTRELKQNPIKAFIKECLGFKKGEYVQALGMRFDEPLRIRAHPEFIYPLWEKRIIKADVAAFFQGDYHRREWYNLEIEEFEGNCDFCFKKSHKKLMAMYEKHPHRFLWWDDIQEKYYDGDDEIFRGRKLARDIFKEGGANEHEKIDLSCSCGHDW